MRGAYSAEASRNLENITAVIAKDFPSAYDGFVARLGAIERQIALWPNSARLVAGRADGAPGAIPLSAVLHRAAGCGVRSSC